MKKTLIIGASPKAERYSNKAARRLLEHGHEIVMLALRAGSTYDQEIRDDRPPLTDIDTVTMYVGPQHQQGWEEYILSLKPQRVIFNPGTENQPFQERLEDHGIEALEACTLVLLSINKY